MERYSLGILSAESIACFEQHLLICPACQDRLAEVDAQLQATQAEARQVRADQLGSRDKAGSSGPSA